MNVKENLQCFLWSVKRKPQNNKEKKIPGKETCLYWERAAVLLWQSLVAGEVT